MTDAIADILVELRRRILERMQAENINASGRTSRSLRVQQYQGGQRLVSLKTEKGFAPFTFGGGGVVTGVAPMATIEVGRKGGNVPRGFYYIIKQWARDKGLSFANEQELGTFAYFVANKIAREGTLRNRQNVDVYSTHLKDAKEQIAKVVTAEVRQMLKTHF